MGLKEIDKRLARLGSMVESWRGKHSVANIERDMALEELRRLYDAILDYSAEQGAQPRSVVRRPVVVDVASGDAEPKEEATEGSSSVVVEFDDALDIDALLGITPDTEEKPVEVVREEPPAEVVAAEEKPDEKPDEKPEDKDERPEHKEDKPEERVDNPEAVTPQSPEVPVTPQTPQTPQSPEAPEECPVEEAKDEKPADEPAAPTEEHNPTSLFDLDDIPVRSRSGRKMVQLYSDGYTGRTPVDPKPDPKPKPKPEPEPKPTPKPEPKPQSVAEVVADTKTVRVADVLGGDVTTLGDKMASDDAPTTPFNKIASLRQAIGINDKFQMIRDLFAGDAARYEATIETLDEFDDLDECMIYIVENFHWNPDSEGAKLLVSLIERKLA